MNYYIFKTNNLTGRTDHVCNGSHETEAEINQHWLCYMYGFMDGAFELLGARNFTMENGSHPLRSFQFSVEGKKNVEYFMLLDKEGQDLINEISK